MRISIKELGSYLVGGILFASGLGVGLFKTGEFESLGIQIWIVMTLGTLERKSWRVSSGSSGSDKLNGQLIPRIWTGTAFLQQWWKFKKRRVLSLQSCCVEPLQELLLFCFLFPHQWALRWPVFILSGLLVVVICCILTFQPSEVAARTRDSIV